MRGVIATLGPVGLTVVISLAVIAAVNVTRWWVVRRRRKWTGRIC